MGPPELMEVSLQVDPPSSPTQPLVIWAIGSNGDVLCRSEATQVQPMVGEIFFPLTIMMELCKASRALSFCWNITHLMYIETEDSTLHDAVHCCDNFLWASLWSYFYTSFGESGLISRSWLCRTGKTGSCIFYAFIFLYVRNGKHRDLISSWKMSETQQHYKDLNHLWLLDIEMVLHFKCFSYCCSYFASKI